MSKQAKRTRTRSHSTPATPKRSRPGTPGQPPAHCPACAAAEAAALQAEIDELLMWLPSPLPDHPRLRENITEQVRLNLRSAQLEAETWAVETALSELTGEQDRILETYGMGDRFWAKQEAAAEATADDAWEVDRWANQQAAMSTVPVESGTA